MLVMFGLYLSRGAADPLIAGGLFLSFLTSLVPALLLLKPFEDREALQRRRERFRREREERERQRKKPRDGGPEEPPRGRGS